MVFDSTKLIRCRGQPSPQLSFRSIVRPVSRRLVLPYTRHVENIEEHQSRSLAWWTFSAVERKACTDSLRQETNNECAREDERQSITPAMHAISSILALAFVAYTQAHGGHDQQPVAPDADWATRHMAGEESQTTLMACDMG